MAREISTTITTKATQTLLMIRKAKVPEIRKAVAKKANPAEAEVNNRLRAKATRTIRKVNAERNCTLIPE